MPDSAPLRLPSSTLGGAVAWCCLGLSWRKQEPQEEGLGGCGTGATSPGSPGSLPRTHHPWSGLCRQGLSLQECPVPGAAVIPAARWSGLSVLPHHSKRRVLGTLQSPQGGPDHWGARWTAHGQSAPEAGSAVRTRLVQPGQALGATAISPAFQEVGEHLALALDADFASAHKVVQPLMQ